MMLFALMKLVLDNAFEVNQRTNTVKEVENEYNGVRSNIDKETQIYCFFLTCLFFIDFISAWFDQYSKYFAGFRSSKVSNMLENIL